MPLQCNAMQCNAKQKLYDQIIVCKTFRCNEIQSKTTLASSQLMLNGSTSDQTETMQSSFLDWKNGFRLRVRACVLMQTLRYGNNCIYLSFELDFVWLVLYN